MEPKPGIKTSEFWLTLLAHLVAIAGLVVGALGEEKWIAIVALVADALASMGYSAGRAKVKASLPANEPKP